MSHLSQAAFHVALRSKGRGCVICTTVSKGALRNLSLIQGFDENLLKSNRKFISNEYIHEVVKELPQDADQCHCPAVQDPLEHLVVSLQRKVKAAMLQWPGKGTKGSMEGER